MKAPTSPQDEYLTVPEAATLVKANPLTIYRMCRAGKLAFIRVGVGRGGVRIPRSAIEALIHPATTEG